MWRSCFFRALMAGCAMAVPGFPLAALAALAAPAAPAATPVTLGVVTWIGYGPIYCAAANGFYRHYGLDVKLVNFADNSVMAGALQSGEILATTLTYDQVIASNARGWKLKVVMPVDYWSVEMPLSARRKFRASRI